jgi:hypothetical protein
MIDGKKGQATISCRILRTGYSCHAGQEARHPDEAERQVTPIRVEVIKKIPSNSLIKKGKRGF